MNHRYTTTLSSTYVAMRYTLAVAATFALTACATRSADLEKAEQALQSGNCSGAKKYLTDFYGKGLTPADLAPRANEVSNGLTDCNTKAAAERQRFMVDWQRLKTGMLIKEVWAILAPYGGLIGTPEMYGFSDVNLSGPYYILQFKQGRLVNWKLKR